MQRRLCRILVLAAILALASGPGVSYAGGVVVSLSGDLPNAEAGVPFTVKFNVISMHNSLGQDGLRPTVVATNLTTKAQVKVTATQVNTTSQAVAPLIACSACPDLLAAPVRKGPAGEYQATLTLPTAGEWSWAINPFGDDGENYPGSVMTPIKVAAAAKPVDSQLSAVPAAPVVTRPAPASQLPWIAGGGFGLLAAAGTWLMFRRRKLSSQV